MLLELPAIEHVDAQSVEEAIFWLHRYGEKGRVVAGGTDLLGLLKDHIVGPGFNLPQVLINIKTIPALRCISYDEQAGLSLGAVVTLKDIINSSIVRDKFPILILAAQQVGTTPLQYMGTLGGNLCQRPRCPYFRHAHFPCRKKGGQKCYAIRGDHRYYHAILNKGKCVAAHPSDMALPLAALDALVSIAGPGGERKLPVLEFFRGPDDFSETVLKPDELVTAIEIPAHCAARRQGFLKNRIRRSADFALVSVAATAQINDAVWEDIRIILGGVAPYPYRALLAEEVLKGKSSDEILIARAAEASMAEARPLRMNGYKIDLARVLVREVLTSIHHAATARGR